MSLYIIDINTVDGDSVVIYLKTIEYDCCEHSNTNALKDILTRYYNILIQKK